MAHFESFPRQTQDYGIGKTIKIRTNDNFQGQAPNGAHSHTLSGTEITFEPVAFLLTLCLLQVL